MSKKFKNPFISLKYKNFRYYWFGMNISLIGSWMQSIAQPWLALTITDDPFLVSIVAVAQFLPTLILSLFSGVLVDKVNTKYILFISQIGLMLVAIGFSIMTILDKALYINILMLATANGIFSCIDAPARHSFVYELVDDDDYIQNAVALNSMAFNVARVLGPGLAGMVMMSFGVKYCFIFNAISFAAIIVSLFFIKPNRKISKQENKGNVLLSIKDGFNYVKNQKIISHNLFITLIITMFIPHYNITISALSKFILDGGEQTFGYLMSFLGIGSFFGAFFIAMYGKLSLRLINIIPFITAFSLFCIGIWQNFWVVALFLSLTGFCFVITAASINSTIQLNTKNEFRGRVMSIYSLFFQGSVPFGAIFTGYFTNKFGANIGLFVCAISAIVCLLVLMFYSKYDKNKPILKSIFFK
ncbi:MAG: MFS transporter [Campylobacter sputorum]|uniref:MFS transporter n=1 Tax=Campylobacter sputorum TaxID=206 RepID=UPI000B784043|nr:MFS transporter [Campylobacter sputorum]ASM39256.1 transmembrane secretion effector, major facilitator superfamily [Campylobacter sputorum bv. paraureolyticus LMG 11764]MDY6121392.1 MFS transporter [Campylobacter sputorum]